ncbi:MAG: PAS domain-containing sensor histidine kinase [Proteobacteria bacterium]|nr:PAS domain-containing sensor histidine kinase [Pseudomonadota bacterium]
MSGLTTFGDKLRAWSANSRLQRNLAFVLVIAAVVSGTMTVASWTGGKNSASDAKTVLYLIYIDGIILLMLGLLVAKQMITVWQKRRSGEAGSGLHVRLMMLFGLVAVTPAILVAVFSALFIQYGVEAWFTDKISAAVNQSVVVGKAYLLEHRKNIYADAFALAGDLNINAPRVGGDPRRLNPILSHHAALRSLSEALVINRGGQVIARSELSLSVKVRQISNEVFDKAGRGEITVLGGLNDERIRAIVRLQSFADAYLLVERFVDPKVISQINLIETAQKRYTTVQKKMGGIQIKFVMIFVVVAVLLLLAAIWIGLTVATQLAKPISSLIAASKSISEGDLSVRVETTDSPDEISALSRAFNSMTEQLKNTQEGLMGANRQIDERRRFTETVLTGVSAGVIGLDAQGNVYLPNRSASELLATDLEKRIGQTLGNAVPEMAGLLTKAMERPDQSHQAEVKIGRDGQFHTLMASIAAEKLEGKVIGYVLTFDDVTELLSAQRKAAWSDVARRIAHEIKNPLTPIQLSAERLKRKYLGEIKSDPETFSSCTDTIIRQVEDLHRMVDEFSSFARMPQLSLGNENLSEICRQALSLEHNRHPDIEYDAELPVDDVRLYCDHRQVSRALTNLLKNAAEAVTALLDDSKGTTAKGRIHLSISADRKKEKDDKDTISIIIKDNGRGLPGDKYEDLTEPYVTTRTKGTGLGLAIVKKIMEDHNGHLILDNNPDGGACVSLIFPPMEMIANMDDGGDEETAMKVATSLLAQGS